MSTTVERNTTFRYPELPGYQITDAANQPPLGPNVKILKGTLAFMDPVDGVVIPGAATTVNNCHVLGIAQETYDNSSVSDPTRMKQVYRRGSCFLVNEQSDPCLLNQIGGFVYVASNDSVQGSAPGLENTQVKLMGLTSDGLQAEVWIF